MIKKKRSSLALTWKVNLGGIKKKFHIKALSTAEINTGNTSKNNARIDSVTNNKNATTLYPMNGVKKKDNSETARIDPRLMKYWVRFGIKSVK